jgi:hypothetical protein
MCGSSSTSVTVRGNVAGTIAGYLTIPTSDHLGIEIVDGYSGIRTLDGAPSNGVLTIKLDSPDFRLVNYQYALSAPANSSMSAMAESIWSTATSYNNSVAYSYPSITGVMPVGGYNSNSVVSGLLQRQYGYATPIIQWQLGLQGKQVPGYGNPLNFGGGK